MSDGADISHRNFVFSTAQDEIHAAIVTRDDDDASASEIVAVPVPSASREGGGRESRRGSRCHSKCCQEENGSGPGE